MIPIEIDTYLEEFPDSSYNNMKERIGYQKDVIFSYYDNIENDDLMNKIHLQNTLKRVTHYSRNIYSIFFNTICLSL